jgi:hypothetical protein
MVIFLVLFKLITFTLSMVEITDELTELENKLFGFIVA